MRITGNDKLDPDFSKIKRSEQILGRIASCDLFRPGSNEWLIPRLNPICENCGNAKAYQIVMSYHVFPFPFIKQNKRYHIVCAVCNERIELEYGEYLTIKRHMNKE